MTLGCRKFVTSILVMSCAGLAHANEGTQRRSQSPATSATESAQLAQVFQAALATVAPHMVRIETVGGAQPVEAAELPGGQTAAAPNFRQADGPTTGLIWSADGYIVTSSFNFVRDPLIITVTLADQRRFVGRLVARDHVARLALLKIEVTGLGSPKMAPPALLHPGQWILTAGFGQGGDAPALSAGVLSGFRHGLALQTDARTSPANYGGPAFDIEGRIAGICVPIGAGNDELAGIEWYDSGIGFAITADQLTRRIDKLRSGDDIERGVMGVTLDPRTPPVPMLLPTSRPAQSATQPATAPGSRPTWIESSPCGGLEIIEKPTGPANAAGLQAGDCIVELDGSEVKTLLAFRRALVNKFAGDSLDVTYVRNGERHDVTLKLVAARDLK